MYRARNDIDYFNEAIYTEHDEINRSVARLSDFENRHYAIKCTLFNQSIGDAGQTFKHSDLSRNL